MKFAIVAAALVVSASSALAAARDKGPELDPNVLAAQGSFSAGSHANPMGIEHANAHSVLSSVPEADVLAMLAAGVAVVGGLAIRRRNRK